MFWFTTAGGSSVAGAVVVVVVSKANNPPEAASLPGKRIPLTVGRDVAAAAIFLLPQQQHTSKVGKRCYAPRRAVASPPPLHARAHDDEVRTPGCGGPKRRHVTQRRARSEEEEELGRPGPTDPLPSSEAAFLTVCRRSSAREERPLVFVVAAEESDARAPLFKESKTQA